jgi:hypothetical protein
MESPLARTLMLVLGVLAMPSAGQAVLNGSHCARHDASAHHQTPIGMHEMTGQHAAASWQNAPRHTCPHCPANECARVAPCSGASSCVIAVTTATPMTFSIDRAGIYPIHDAVHSVLEQPPTAPPLLVS